MTTRARKTFGLSMAILALAFVHFFFARMLISSGGLGLAAVLFIIIGLAQAGLGIFGAYMALRKQ